MDKLVMQHRVNTEALRKAVCVVKMAADTLFSVMNENQSFRMILEYDAETLVTKINFYKPTDE